MLGIVNKVRSLLGIGPPARTGHRVRLRSGHRVLVRPVQPEDAALLAAGFAALSEESRFRRFFTIRPALTEPELEYFTHVDHHDHEALGAISASSGAAVGVARYVRSAAEPASAEIAVTVVDEWQGRGVGGVLLGELAERARAEGITCFTAEVLLSNQPMLALLRRLGPAELTHTEGATVSVRVPLGGP